MLKTFFSQGRLIHFCTRKCHRGNPTQPLTTALANPYMDGDGGEIKTIKLLMWSRTDFIESPRPPPSGTLDSCNGSHSMKLASKCTDTFCLMRFSNTRWRSIIQRGKQVVAVMGEMIKKHAIWVKSLIYFLIGWLMYFPLNVEVTMLVYSSHSERALVYGNSLQQHQLPEFVYDFNAK